MSLKFKNRRAKLREPDRQCRPIDQSFARTDPIPPRRAISFETKIGPTAVLRFEKNP